MSARGRGRPRKDQHIRVRAERRREIDYPKLARALLEQAALEEHQRRFNQAATEEGASHDSTERTSGAPS